MSIATEQTRTSDLYLRRVQEVLAIAAHDEADAILHAAQTVADAFARDGILYVFGSGHSHVFAEEAFYRAGGAARISPILQDDYMLHVSAQRSTEPRTAERPRRRHSRALSDPAWRRRDARGVELRLQCASDRGRECGKGA